MVTSPRHVPPIVERYPPGSATHLVRGQMSPRPLTWVTTRQTSASDLNKHWNKLRWGREWRTRRWNQTHLLKVCMNTWKFMIKWRTALQFSSAVLFALCAMKWRFTLHLTECLPLVVMYDTEKVQFCVDINPSNHCDSNPIILFHVFPITQEQNSKNALYAGLYIYFTTELKAWCTG